MTIGRTGELLFKEKMERAGYAMRDVSNDSDYWHKDIDFFATSPTTGAVKSFEVKWDSRINQTGNLYIELTNVHSKGGKGWFTFCEADYIAYGDAAARCFYVIPLVELKARIQLLPQRKASCGADSTGLLVSLRDIEDLVALV